MHICVVLVGLSEYSVALAKHRHEEVLHICISCNVVGAWSGCMFSCRTATWCSVWIANCSGTTLLFALTQGLVAACACPIFPKFGSATQLAIKPSGEPQRAFHEPGCCVSTWISMPSLLRSAAKIHQTFDTQSIRPHPSAVSAWYCVRHCTACQHGTASQPNQPFIVHMSCCCATICCDCRHRKKVRSSF